MSLWFRTQEQCSPSELAPHHQLDLVHPPGPQRDESEWDKEGGREKDGERERKRWREGERER